MYMADTFLKVMQPTKRIEAASPSRTASSAKSDVDPSVEGTFQRLLQEIGTESSLPEQSPLQMPLANLPSNSEELAECLAALMLFQPPTAAQTLMSASVPSMQTAAPTSVSAALAIPTELIAAPVAPLAQAESKAPLLIPTQAQTQPKTAEAPAATLLASTNTSEQITKITVQSGSDSDSLDYTSNTEPQTKPLFQSTEHIPVKVGETPLLDTESANFDAQLSRQISQALKQGEQKLSIRLAPAHLGTVVVELTRTPDGAISLLLQASSTTATTLLQDRSSELSGLLRNSTGAPVYVEVQQAQDRGPFDQQQQQQGNGRQGSQQQNSHSRQQSQDFIEQLRLGITALDPEDS